MYLRLWRFSYVPSFLKIYSLIITIKKPSHIETSLAPARAIPYSISHISMLRYYRTYRIISYHTYRTVYQSRRNKSLSLSLSLSRITIDREHREKRNREKLKGNVRKIRLREILSFCTKSLRRTRLLVISVNRSQLHGYETSSVARPIWNGRISIGILIKRGKSRVSTGFVTYEDHRHVRRRIFPGIRCKETRLVCQAISKQRGTLAFVSCDWRNSVRFCDRLLKQSYLVVRLIYGVDSFIPYKL